MRPRKYYTEEERIDAMRRSSREYRERMRNGQPLKKRKFATDEERREARKLYEKEYRCKNAEKISERKKAYYARNREHVKEYKKKWEKQREMEGRKYESRNTVIVNALARRRPMSEDDKESRLNALPESVRRHLRAIEKIRQEKQQL